MSNPTSSQELNNSDFESLIVHDDARLISQTLPKNSVQCIITSPPYWGLRCYGAENEIGGEATLEEYLDNISSVFKGLWDALANNGTVWLILGDSYTSGNRGYRDTDKRHPHRGMTNRPKTPAGLKPKDLIGLPWRIAFRLQADGWFLRSETIWHKPNPIPESVKDRPHQSHEHIFLLSKSKNYKFDWDALSSVASDRFRATRSVWTLTVGNRSKGVHAAPFPVELIEPCILASTEIGDLVLDPFAGSASVGISCIKLQRRFLGVELVSANVDIARSRLAESQLLYRKQTSPSPEMHIASLTSRVELNILNKDLPTLRSAKEFSEVGTNFISP